LTGWSLLRWCLQKVSSLTAPANRLIFIRRTSVQIYF